MTDTLNLGPLLQGPSDDDSAVLRHALRLIPDDSTGWGLEFGVGKGGTLAIMAERLPTIGFDSFLGLPEDWRTGFPAGTFALGSKAEIPRIEGATVVVGLFEDTLPYFDWPDAVAIVHIDCDLYSSTATALLHCGHLIQAGTLVVFDEYHSYDGAREHEERAWEDWCLEQSAITEPIGHGREQAGFRVLGFGESVND